MSTTRAEEPKPGVAPGGARELALGLVDSGRTRGSRVDRIEEALRRAYAQGYARAAREIADDAHQRAREATL